MKKNFPRLVLPLFMLITSSCGLYKDKGYQQVSYYQDLDRSGVTREAIQNYQPLRIQTGDVLGINLSSPTPEATAIFNSSVSRENGNNLDVSAINPVYGFKVDLTGHVQFPLVGSMKVDGLTTDEVAADLEGKLKDYVKTPIVNVRVLNFKISVLGDVVKPDMYTVPNEHININEALSLAGDLSITAKRTNVLLVREENGQRQFVTIDLTKKDVFDSPYYYLHNNDVLYVDADKTKYDNIARSFKTNTLVLSTSLAVLTIIASAFFVYHK